MPISYQPGMPFWRITQRFTASSGAATTSSQRRRLKRGDDEICGPAPPDRPMLHSANEFGLADAQRQTPCLQASQIAASASRRSRLPRPGPDRTAKWAAGRRPAPKNADKHRACPVSAGRPVSECYGISGAEPAGLTLSRRRRFRQRLPSNAKVAISLSPMH